MDYHQKLLKLIPGESPYRLHAVVLGVILVGAAMYASVHSWSSQQTRESGKSEVSSVLSTPGPSTSHPSTTEPSLALSRSSSDADHDQSAGMRRDDARFEEQQRIIAAQQQQLKTLANSSKSVQKARLVRFQSKVKSIQTDLTQLRENLTEWQTLQSALETSDAGRRIVGSVSHLQIAQDLWQKPGPAVDQIMSWEEELAALTEHISPSAEETVVLTDEHVTALDDLASIVADEASSIAKQLRMLKLIQEETASLPAGKQTLVTAIESGRLQQEKSEMETLQQAASDARSKGLAKRAAEIAKVEEEAGANEAENELARKQFETKQREDKNRREAEERERKAAEERLEAEFLKEMNEIKGLLLAYTSDGYTYRPDGTKGPVSLSLIRSRGGLKQTRDGLQALFFIARGNSDRKSGGLPEGVGGHISSATPLEPIERAQELLIKYGDLMVTKGMLAP